MNMASSVTSSCSVPFLVKQELTSLVMLPAHQSSHLRGQAAPPSLLLAPESMTTLYYRCISCSECFFTEERFVAHAKAVHCKVLVSQGQDPGQTSAVEPSACNAVSSHMTVVHAETLNPNILSNGTFLQSAAAQQGNLAVKSEASNLDFGIPGPLDSWPWNSAADTANWKKPPNVDYQCDGGMFKTVDKRATEVGGSPAMETDDDDDGLCVLETCGYPYSAAAVATTTTNSEESDIVEALKKLQEEIQPRAATTTTMQRDASDAGGLPIVTAVSGAAQIPAPTTRRRRRGRPSLDQREEEVPAKVEEPAAAVAVQPVHSPPWRCKVCNAMFAQSGLLKRHVNQHHSPNKPEYRCGSCDATFRWLGTLRAHQRSHDGRASSEMPYKCDVCAAPFRQLVQLQSHRRVHSDERPWGCATCGATFARETTLYIHRRIHTGEKPHACELCGKTFRQIGTLKTHRRVHTGEKPYQCSVCEKSFAQQGALKAHYRVHSMEKPYQCGTCGRTFSQLSTLNNHERLHAPPPFPAEQPPSTAPPPFPAEQPPPSTAPAPFPAEQPPPAQAVAPPGGGGGHPYKCDTCGAVFAMKHVLAVHMRVHTGERPFPCDECGKTFSQRATLNNHRRVHAAAAAAAAGDQAHACGRCPATFPNAHALSAHHASGSCGGADGDATSSAASASSAASESKGLHHEPVVPNATAASWNCDTCGAEFAHQSSLSIHRRIHTGEKPYPCDLCGKTFRQKGTMQTHRRIHTGEKPYKCDLCNKAFTQLSPLKTHKKTHIERKL